MGNVSQDKFNELSRWGFGIPRGVPEAPPDESASQRACNPGQVLDGGDPRVFIEANLGVGEVVVVDQDEVRANLAESFGDVRELTINVELGAPYPLKRSVLCGVIEAHRQAVWAKCGPVGGGSLSNLEVRDHARIVH